MILEIFFGHFFSMKYAILHTFNQVNVSTRERYYSGGNSVTVVQCMREKEGKLWTKGETHGLLRWLAWIRNFGSSLGEI